MTPACVALDNHDSEKRTEDSYPKLLIPRDLRETISANRPVVQLLLSTLSELSASPTELPQMTRHIWATVALLNISSLASASLARPQALGLPYEARLVVKSLPTATAPVPPPAQAELSGETEVFLNGLRSDYKNIPPTAAVARVVLAADGKTIVRIEFTTSK